MVVGVWLGKFDIRGAGQYAGTSWAAANSAVRKRNFFFLRETSVFLIKTFK